MMLAARLAIALLLAWPATELVVMGHLTLAILLLVVCEIGLQAVMHRGTFR